LLLASVPGYWPLQPPRSRQRPMVKNLFQHKPESPGGDVQGVQQGRTSIKWGKVCELSPEHCQVRVETDELDEIPTYWLSILLPKTWHDKYYWMPELDEHVWFAWDEQAEEGVVLGAFYCAEVPLSELHEPTPHKTEIHWGDDSFVYYDREEHELNLTVKGAIEQRATDGDFNLEASEDMKLWATNITLEACETITLRAPEIILEGNVTMGGGGGGLLSMAFGAATLAMGPGGLALGGASILGNGVPLAGIGGAISSPSGPGAIISGGLGGFGGLPGGGIAAPECPEPEEAEEVEVELEGDLRRLQGYTPPGFGGE
jgi:phage baseplate assembly protein gpV